MKALEYKSLILTAILAISTMSVQAEDITDTVTDVEEITADSEAAKQRSREAQAELVRERTENQKTLREAMRTKKEAEAKREQAAAAIRSSELEIERLAQEHRRLQTDIDKLQFNILAAERIIQKSKDKIDQRKQQNEALAAIKKEKSEKLAALNKEQMELVRSASAFEDEHSLLQKDIEKLTQDELKAVRNSERVKTEAAYKRVELEKRIASLKERYKKIRQQRHAADLEARKANTINQRLEGTLKAGEIEVQGTDEPKAAPTPEKAEPQATQTISNEEKLASGR